MTLVKVLSDSSRKTFTLLQIQLEQFSIHNNTILQIADLKVTMHREPTVSRNRAVLNSRIEQLLQAQSLAKNALTNSQAISGHWALFRDILVKDG